MTQFSRRDVLRGSTALAASGAFASVTSAAPPASAVTPELIAAAKKEGRVVYYTSIDLPVAERIAKAFEATYPGIAPLTSWRLGWVRSRADSGIGEP